MTPIPIDDNLISYCGFYCGACPKFQKNECTGCKGDHPVCLKTCKVRPCNIENNFTSCADCKKYESVKSCIPYNPLMIRFGQFITGTSRRKGIEMIKEKGREEFIKFMVEHEWVTIKKNIN